MTHPIIEKYVDAAQSNAARHRKELLTKLRDILRKADVPSGIVGARATEVYESKRAEILEHMHVSINVRSERVIRLVDKDILQPSIPKNIYSRLHRENAEQCFDESLEESPIYGALNVNSARGAAPLYCPDIWLRLFTSDVIDRTTFTARDSYNVVLPYLAEFEPVRGREALICEIYTWETVPDYFLNRFWDLQDADTTAYIEAQVWGGVSIDSVESFHVETKMIDSFITQLEKCANANNVKYVEERLTAFD